MRTQSCGWDAYKRLITEEGHKPMDFFYASTDYSRDGEVLCLLKATKGKGINIVFMGDGWTYDYEEIVAADEAGRREAAEAYARSSANRSAGRYVERSENYQLGLPPMLLALPPE